VQRLLKGVGNKAIGDSGKTVYKQVVDMLLRSDSSIAERCVLTAERLSELQPGSKKWARSARERYEKALQETDAARAADGFKNAWDTAQEWCDSGVS